MRLKFNRCRFCLVRFFKCRWTEYELYWLTANPRTEVPGYNYRSIQLRQNPGLYSRSSLYPSPHKNSLCNIYKRTSSMLRLASVTDCPMHTPVDHGRSVVSSHRSSSLEQSSTSCHIRIVSDCIPKSPEDLSLRSLFLVTSL